MTRPESRLGLITRRSWVRIPPPPPCDVARHRKHLNLRWRVQVFQFLGLVAAGWVECECSEEFAGGHVDDNPAVEWPWRGPWIAASSDCIPEASPQKPEPSPSLPPQRRSRSWPTGISGAWLRSRWPGRSGAVRRPGSFRSGRGWCSAQWGTVDHRVVLGEQRLQRVWVLCSLGHADDQVDRLGRGDHQHLG